MSKIRPARGYVLVEPLEVEEISSGGVVLPERAKELPQKGKVLVVGDEYIEISTGTYEGEYNTGLKPCKVGDIVIFKRFVDNRIKEEGKELLLVKFEDIIATYG